MYKLSKFSTITKFLLIIIFSPLVYSNPICDRALKVGWDDWPPYQIKSEGDPKGIDPDILQEISKIIGCKVIFEEIPWKRQLEMLKQGLIDIVPQANITKEREKYAIFSIKYLLYESRLWLNTTNLSQPKNLQSFLDSNELLGITRGYSYGKNTDEIINNPKYTNKIKSGTYTKQIIGMLAEGRLDGILGNRFTVGYIAKKESLHKKIRATGIVVQSDPVYFMFSKKSISMPVLNSFNKAILELDKKQIIKRIANSYTGEN
ncbi:transporter substrate-binding domain-containing protein [Endozoicomonas sp. SM1973]|uniref:Transporter substrate-binding domain-containing protein n=1 Tax=Spartinivicinus marinus TaxID=2994442 RepID=A0A853IAG8_9GAMM|nr:transporter substrate-binding domain-containing protein [Spartinivicinus marinus]MCX4025154.1 transporter substrate-binding domain-containing protein [Spartinivicinus marinus]NYZ69929.1 transporter substrate-binding domain-containing protein [Spartinivicinus marinus]